MKRGRKCEIVKALTQVDAPPWSKWDASQVNGSEGKFSISASFPTSNEDPGQEGEASRVAAPLTLKQNKPVTYSGWGHTLHKLLKKGRTLITNTSDKISVSFFRGSKVQMVLNMVAHRYPSYTLSPL